MSSEQLTDFQRDFWTAIDAVYQRSVGESGEPLGLALFDIQVLCPLEWLVEHSGAPKEEILGLVEEGVLPRRKQEDGELGFTIFTEAQLRFMREIRESQLCSEDEIKHIIRRENEFIEGVTLEVLPYDDQGLSDLENLNRRIARETEEIGEQRLFLKERFEGGLCSEEDFQKQEESSVGLVGQFERLHRIFGGKTEDELTDRQREHCRKQLFRLRWLDEWTRIQDTRQFEAQVRQGYSAEFTFRSWRSNGLDEYSFGMPDWRLTLESFKNSRSLGRRFPLRTPDFSVSEEGLILKLGTTADKYSEIYVRYGLDDLNTQVERFGGELWNPKELPSGTLTCIGCGCVFRPQSPKRKYCSEDCRQSAKHRRWRERDPERAREATAKYWTRYYPGLAKVVEEKKK